MAVRKTLQRQLLSPSYRPEVRGEIGAFQQQVKGIEQTSNLLNQMSNFFFKEMETRVVEEGAMLGAANPITIEELKKAAQTGEDVTDRLGYGAKGQAARKTAFQVLQHEMEMEASRDYQNFMTKASQDQLSSQEIADGLDAITIGYTDLLKGVDPIIKYNTKAKLSVITSDLYSDYLQDEIKKQNSIIALKQVRDLEQDIENIIPMMNLALRENKPQEIAPMISNYRTQVEGAIFNTAMTDANKLKGIKEANSNIDSAIIRTMTKYSQDNNIDLSTFIKNFRQSAKVVNDKIVYNVKNPDLSSLVNSLSRTGQNNLTDELKAELDKQIEIATIQSNQNVEVADAAVAQIKQETDKFLVNYEDGDVIPLEVQNNVNMLKKYNSTEYEKYSQKLTDIQSDYAIEIDTTLVSSLEQQIDTLEGIEMDELYTYKPRLTRDDFLRFKEDVAKKQNEEIKRFVKTVSTGPKYAASHPEYQGDLTGVLVFSEEQKAVKEKRKFIQDQMELESERASVAGESFNAFDFYNKLKSDPQHTEFFKDPLGAGKGAEKIAKFTQNILQDNFGDLNSIGFFRGVVSNTDTIEYYEEISKNFNESMRKKALKQGTLDTYKAATRLVNQRLQELRKNK